MHTHTHTHTHAHAHTCTHLSGELSSLHGQLSSRREDECSGTDLDYEKRREEKRREEKRREEKRREEKRRDWVLV